MLEFVRQKIKNKMWLSLCLVLGLSFLVAVFSCHPMFKSGSLDRLLHNMFVQYIEENNEYPTVMSREASYSAESYHTAAEIYAGMRGYQDTWEKYLPDLSVVTTQTGMEFGRELSRGTYGTRGNYLSVTYMPDLLAHAEILVGEDYEGSLNAPYPCIISQGVMDEYGLTVGEVIDFVNWENESGVTLKLVIAGIFKEAEQTDVFWYKEPNEFEESVFVSETVFDEILSQYGEEKTIKCSHTSLFDYNDVTNEKVDDLEYYLEQFRGLDANFGESFSGLLAEYKEEERTINVILWVLELPILGMVLAFIYMVSKQMISAEQDEIAMLKSRGFSRRQVLFVFLLQSVILSLFALLVGLPLGYLLCKLAAGTTDFLTFSMENLGIYHFRMAMLLYGLAALFIGIFFIMIPVFHYSRVSIVERKASKNQIKKMAWEKYFVDIVLLGVSIYLLFTYNRSIENIRHDALTGVKTDPMIFLNAVLFIIALGLVILRLNHYLINLIFFLGKKRWKPDMYASFLQISRAFDKQGFIAVFLILTIALGLFYANTARTINRNNEDRIIYENGADVVVREKWEMNRYTILVNGSTYIIYDYDEPDYMKFKHLVENGVCESATRVIFDDKMDVSKGSLKMPNCMLQGINTKEFGETAYLKEELNRDVHWYHYLNALAVKPNGVIISGNLAEFLGVEVGDTIDCTRYSVLRGQEDEVRGSMRGEVCAIVDAWPGFDQYYYVDGEQQENYLVVANYANVVSNFQMSPYEVWYKLAEGVTADDVYSILEEEKIDMLVFDDVDALIADMKHSPMIQITNGMFTLSFIIAIVLCAVGFLIYWISSIRQRELLFGVYRAMGMSMHEINRMLVNEHIFSTLLSVLAGGLAGMISTLLFVRLFGIVYLPEKHNLDIYTYFEPGDVVKLGIVIAIMIVVCGLVLRRLIRSMNITQALKLGED